MFWKTENPLHVERREGNTFDYVLLEADLGATVGNLGDSISWTSRAWKSAVKVSKALKPIRILAGPALLSTCAELADDVKDFVLAKKTSKRIDSGLRVGSDLSSILYYLSVFAVSLRELNLVARQSVSWAGKVMAVSIPLQTATLLVHVREWYHTKKLIKKLDTVRPLKLVDAIEERLRTGEIKKLRSSLGMMTKEKTQALKDRLFSKKLSHKLGALAVVISLVAATVFLLSPVSPLGYVLFGLGGLLEVAIWVHDYAVHRKFCKEMDLPVKDVFVVRAAITAKKKIQELAYKSIATHASDATLRKLAASELSPRHQ